MKDTDLINAQFKCRNMNIIWNKLKTNKKLKVNTNLNADDFESHFSDLTKDSEPLSADQVKIQTAVVDRSSYLTRIKNVPVKGNDGNLAKCTECGTNGHGCGNNDTAPAQMNIISGEYILKAIKNLKKGTSPGSDSISAEHLIYALSPKLADLLANVYSIMITSATIPEIFKKSIIVPLEVCPYLTPKKLF